MLHIFQMCLFTMTDLQYANTSVNMVPGHIEGWKSLARESAHCPGALRFSAREGAQ